MLYRSPAYKVFTWFNHLFLVATGLLCLLPLVHIFSVSLSSRAAATANIVNFWPVGFTVDAYMQTLGNDNFLQALLTSVNRVVLGTSISMAVMLLAAYSLSKSSHRFAGRGIYTWFFVFPILFNGGLITTFLVVKDTGLLDSIWALVIPGAVSGFNLILLLNFFRGIPVEMEEAALIDGAGHFTILWKIILPMSTAAIATISLFIMVGHWNSWFDGMIYLTDTADYPLATFLQSVVARENFNQVGLTPGDLSNISNRTVKASQIFIGAIPILLVYPFLQKYFVKGIVLGSVKE